MEDVLNSDEARVYKAFLRAHASIMRELEKTLQEVEGISVAWLDVLTQLSLAEGQRMTHTRLGERLLIGGGGGITRLVDRMAKADLVSRRASRKDRRTSYVVLTEKGIDVFNRASKSGFVVVQERFIQHLHEDEVPVMREFFKRVLGEN